MASSLAPTCSRQLLRPARRICLRSEHGPIEAGLRIGLTESTAHGNLLAGYHRVRVHTYLALPPTWSRQAPQHVRQEPT